jgi:hypothetical protein
VSRQRWGTFSVVDHQRPRAFVAEVLLYDKLIIPTPSDTAERVRWREIGRDPDRLDRNLDILGKTAIRVPWDEPKREAFKTRFASARAVAFDADNLEQARFTNVDPLYMTRMLLAQDFLPEMPKGVMAWPIAAYSSCMDYREDIARQTPAERKEDLAMVLTHRFFVPEEPGKSDEEMLRKAVQLAERDDFQEKRAKFHEWQEEIIRDGIPDAKAVEEMEEYLQHFYAIAKKAKANVYWRWAFMAIPALIATATAGLGVPLVAAGATGLISVAAFAKFDSMPKIEACRYDNAAMIHDVERTFRPR